MFFLDTRFFMIFTKFIYKLKNFRYKLCRQHSFPEIYIFPQNTSYGKHLSDIDHSPALCRILISDTGFPELQLHFHIGHIRKF